MKLWSKCGENCWYVSTHPLPGQHQNACHNCRQHVGVPANPGLKPSQPDTSRQPGLGEIELRISCPYHLRCLKRGRNVELSSILQWLIFNLTAAILSLLSHRGFDSDCHQVQYAFIPAMVTREIPSNPAMRCCERRPIALPLAGVPGALLLSVGDVATVTVQVSSMLPTPLQLRGLTLRLTLLQETSGALFTSTPAFQGFVCGHACPHPPMMHNAKS